MLCRIGVWDSIRFWSSPSRRKNRARRQEPSQMSTSTLQASVCAYMLAVPGRGSFRAGQGRRLRQSLRHNGSDEPRSIECVDTRTRPVQMGLMNNRRSPSTAGHCFAGKMWFLMQVRKQEERQPKKLFKEARASFIP